MLRSTNEFLRQFGKHRRHKNLHQTFPGSRKSDFIITRRQHTAHFWVKHWFWTKFDQTFPGPRNSYLVSVGRNCAVNFITNEEPLGRDTDFRQCLIKGFRGSGIRIRSQLVEIMRLIFSLTKAFWAESDFRQCLIDGFRRWGVRIRCQMTKMIHLIFPLTKHLWAGKVDFPQSLTKRLQGWGIQIWCQMVQIMHFIFSLTKHLSAEILIFDKVWPRIFWCDEFESGLSWAKLDSQFSHKWRPFELGY